MKLTEENVVKQRSVDKKQGADKNVKSGRSNQAKAKSSTGERCSLSNGDIWYYDSLLKLLHD